MPREQRSCLDDIRPLDELPSPPQVVSGAGWNLFTPWSVTGPGVRAPYPESLCRSPNAAGITPEVVVLTA